MQFVPGLDLLKHVNAVHINPILVDVMDHEVRAVYQDGIGQALAKVDPPAGERCVRAGNLHPDTLKPNHDRNLPFLFAFGNP